MRPASLPSPTTARERCWHAGHVSLPACPPCRRKRLAELQQGAARPRYGSLEEMRGSDFVSQVTNAGEGVWVVCHLYKDRWVGMMSLRL